MAIYTFEGLVYLNVDIEAENETQAHQRLGHVLSNSELSVSGESAGCVVSSVVMLTEDFGMPAVTEIDLGDDDDEEEDAVVEFSTDPFDPSQ